MISPKSQEYYLVCEYAYRFLHQFFGGGHKSFSNEGQLKKIQEEILNANNFQKKLQDFDQSLQGLETNQKNKIKEEKIIESCELIKTIAHDYLDLSKEITSFLKSTEWAKVDPQDKVFLLLGAAEILKIKKYKDPDTINVLVELAKKYGDEGSGPLINGILDQIYKGKK